MKSKRAINLRFALNPLDRFARFRIRGSLLSFPDDKIWYNNLYQGISLFYLLSYYIILYHIFSFQDSVIIARYADI